ncbi:MAG: hypothetical protein LW807_03290 [Proteobacteria bacterium]|jgi:cell shape-determining protein MreD|nr:hypothetical protein [Pseudomonadota bacterium]
MQTSSLKAGQIKLIVLTLFLSIVQLLINSSSIIYADLLGVFLVVLLVNQFCLYRQLIIIAFFADIVGHWYLGTHLFALITISFLADKYFNFYKISNIFQKIISIIVFYSLFNGVITIIGLLTHNIRVDTLSFIIEIIVLCPIMFAIVGKILGLSTVDTLFND